MARTQRNTSQWQALIEEQKQSSLTIKEFCRQQDVTTSGFYGWRKRLKLIFRTGFKNKFACICHLSNQ
jgi:hypothetical protein